MLHPDRIAFTKSDLSPNQSDSPGAVAAADDIVTTIGDGRRL